jgi:hypothetical protein
MEKINELEIVENDPKVEQAEKKNTQATCWVGTWNNPKMTDDEFLETLKKFELDGHLQYACFQRECGEMETPHFQFFIVWKNAKRFKWCKENLPYGCHFKPMVTNMAACKNYCTKKDTRISENFYEVGEFINKGSRSDLAECRKLLKDGMPFEQVADLYPTQCLMYERQLKSFEQTILKLTQRKNRRVNLVVNYVYGKSGQGKTCFILDKYGDENVYRVSNYKKHPFDFYENEKVIVFEEYHSQLDFDDLLNFLDIYFCPLPARYNHKIAVYEKVYMTSNETVDKLYPEIRNKDSETWNALMRRIHNVYNYDDTRQREMLRNGTPNKNPFYTPLETKVEQAEMRLLTPEETAGLPF